MQYRLISSVMAFAITTIPGVTAETRCESGGTHDQLSCSAAIGVLQGSYDCEDSFGGPITLVSANGCDISCSRVNGGDDSLEANNIIPDLNIANQRCNEDTIAVAVTDGHYLEIRSL